MNEEFEFEHFPGELRLKEVGPNKEYLMLLFEHPKIKDEFPTMNCCFIKCGDTSDIEKLRNACESLLGLLTTHPIKICHTCNQKIEE